MHAQTSSSATYPSFDTASNVQTPCAGLCKPFEDAVAYILLPTVAGQQSLTLNETRQLRDALSVASDLATKALNATADQQARAIVESQAAIAALQTLQNSIALAHGWDSTSSAKMPYQITFQEATVLSFSPTIWIKTAIDGQTVHLLKGTVLRYGAPAGTLRSYPSDNHPLPVDSFLAPVTLTADTDLAVGGNFLTSADPAFGYVKEIDVQSGTGGTTAKH